MTVRAWAIKPGELKPLDRASRLRLAIRCALRVEPWVTAHDHALWLEQLTFALSGAAGAPLDSAESGRRQRLLNAAGAHSCTQVMAKDEPLGRCHSYAMATAGAVLAACAAPAGPALNKQVIDAAKYAASIAAVLGHAGRTSLPPPPAEAVDVVVPAFWDEVRADVARVGALADPSLEALRALAPLLSEELRAWLQLGR